MERYDLLYHLKEGYKSIFTHGLMSFAAVCMIMACLLIMGSFSLVAVNLDFMLGALESENEFLAYIDETLSEEEARALQSGIEEVANVASATFITREEARDRYAEKYAASKNKTLFADLPGDIFRHRFSIHVTDIEQMSATVEEVSSLPMVANVRAEEEIVQGFVIFRNVAGAVALILIGLLAVISLFIIANTIRLTTFTRREEIAIMKMCGATNWFIRWPFLFEGMILGLLGAMVAYFIQWGIYAVIIGAVAQFGGLQLITIVPFQSLAGQVFGIFAVSGLLIGTAGSLLAIRKFLQT